MTPPPPIDWQCRGRTLRTGSRTLIMGILNVTPDSFSDGGTYADADAAAEMALEMAEHGADIIDVGGESTRPGAEPVSEAEELGRTLPVIERIRRHSDVPISIDTTKPRVAALAMEAGADIINDVSAFESDPAMAETAAETGAGVVLMHMRGTPRTMQRNPEYDAVVAEVLAYLEGRLRFAVAHGVEATRIAIDPGIGFGKRLEHNLELLRNLPVLASLGRPVLVGASRKSFIGTLTGRGGPAERLAGSLGVAAWSILAGAHILRVHDVIDTCDVCRVVDRLRNGEM